MPNTSATCQTYSGAYTWEEAYDDSSGGGSGGGGDGGGGDGGDGGGGGGGESNASGLPFGTRSRYWARPLASPRCVDFGEHESSAGLRSALLLLDALLPPLVCLCVAKLLASLMLLAPCFREVKKLSRKLQFTAEVRKAEVRRMSAAGAEFMVKRVSKAAGQDSDAAVATMKKLTDDKERRAALLKQMAKQSLFIAAIQGSRTNKAGRSSRVSWGDSASARSSARYAAPSSAEPLARESAPVAEGVAERDHAAASGGAAPIAAIPSSTSAFGTELRALTQSLERRTAAANGEGPGSSQGKVAAQEL